MEDLAFYTRKLVEGIKPLTELVPGKAILDYFSTCIKRLVEPHINRYKLIQDAKTQEKLFSDFPLVRIKQCQELICNNPLMIPEASTEAFENAFKIGLHALEYINGDIENAHDPHILSDNEWIDRFVDNAKYISDEKLQMFWGRLLKEKIFNSDNVNKRVLNIVSNLDAKELETIQKYMSCFLEESIPTQVMIDTEFGLEMLVELHNLGLVSLINSPNPFHVIEKAYAIEEKNDTIYGKGCKFVFSGIAEPFEINVPSYFLTKEGVVVYNLIEEPMQEDMVSLYKTIFENSCKGKAVLTIEK